MAWPYEIDSGSWIAAVRAKNVGTLNPADSNVDEPIAVLRKWRRVADMAKTSERGNDGQQGTCGFRPNTGKCKRFGRQGTSFFNVAQGVSNSYTQGVAGGESNAGPHSQCGVSSAGASPHGSAASHPASVAGRRFP